MNRVLHLLVPFGLVGCLGGQTYRQLRREAATAPSSEYYLHEISRALPAPDPAPADTALAEIKARLEASAQQEAGKGAAAAAAGLGLSAELRQAAAVSNADPATLDAALKGPLALAPFLALVHERHPGIAAARQDVRAALLRYPQAAALDDVLAQYNAFTKQLDTLVTTQPQKAMTAMQFPYPDVAALKGQLVAIDVALARIDLERRTRDVLTEARLAWLNYAYLRAALAITRENVELLDSLVRVTRARYQDGQALYGDALSAQMEWAMVAEDEQSLRDRLGAARAALNALLDRPAEAALGDPEARPEARPEATVEPTLDEVTTLALQQRQELQRQRVEIQRMETMAEMAARMAVPDPTSGASYLDSRATIASGTAATATVMGEMAASGTFAARPPLDLAQAAQYGRESAYVRETAVRAVAMKGMLAAMENETRAMVKERWADLATATRRGQTLYRDAQIPLARQAVQAAETAYSSGKADFMTTIETQRTLLRYRLEAEEARRDGGEALARLEQTVGASLPVALAPVSEEVRR
jgi:outer membrane protein TolC